MSEMRGRAQIRRGFTLLELLLALGICAMLLTALAAMVQSSAQTIKLNDSYFRATQTARVAMQQLCAAIRGAGRVEISGDGMGLEITVARSQRAPGELNRVYRFDPASHRIVLVVRSSHGSIEREVAQDVAAARFEAPAVRTSASGQTTIVSVPLSITCTIDDATVTLNGSAAPMQSGF